MVASTAIGGTLQYGYNLAIMNAPTTVRFLFLYYVYWLYMCLCVFVCVSIRLHGHAHMCGCVFECMCACQCVTVCEYIVKRLFVIMWIAGGR